MERHTATEQLHGCHPAYLVQRSISRNFMEQYEENGIRELELQTLMVRRHVPFTFEMNYISCSKNVQSAIINRIQ